MRRPLLAAAMLLLIACPAFAQYPFVRYRHAPTLALYVPEYDSKGRLYYSVTTYTDGTYWPVSAFRSQAVFQAYDRIYADVAALPPVGYVPPPPPELDLDPYAAQITLMVPDVAEVWVQGQKLAQAGAERRVISPPLPEGEQYQYSVKVRWQTGDKVIERDLKVPVEAGTRQVVLVTEAAGQAK